MMTGCCARMFSGDSKVTALGLRFEALGFPRHIDNFLKLITRHSEMKVVIDHCMKPDIAGRWRRIPCLADGMSRLARDTAAFCKFSALITEANPNWTTEDLRPYAEHVITVFGAERVMWGQTGLSADLPVSMPTGVPPHWTYRRVQRRRKTAIYGDTANRFYDLGL